MNIGMNIKNLRAEKRVKQDELAEYLQISAQAVSKWETGAATPDISLLPAISTYFGVSIDELFAIPEDEQFERIENMIDRERRIPTDTFESAVKFLNDQVAKDSKNVRAYEDLAFLFNHQAASAHELANDYAKKILELDVNNRAGWVAYQEANNALCGDEWYDNHFDVIQFCREVLEKYPDNYDALYAIIENLIGDKCYNDVMTYIDMLEKVAPEKGTYIFYKGDVAYGKGDIEKAKEFWNQGVKEFGHRWQSYCMRADRIKKLGMIDEAISDYEKSYDMQDGQRIAEGLYSMAQVHEALKDYKAAINDHERIIDNLAKDYNITTGEIVDKQKRAIEKLKKMI